MSFEREPPWDYRNELAIEQAPAMHEQTRHCSSCGRTVWVTTWDADQECGACGRAERYPR